MTQSGLQFAEHQGPQLVNKSTPRQRFTHASEQKKLGRTGKDRKTQRAIVKGILDFLEYRRLLLRFVNHGATDFISPGKGGHLTQPGAVFEGIEIYIAQVGVNLLKQSRFAGLARAGKNNDAP